VARIVVIGSAARDEVIHLTEPLRAGGHLNGVTANARLGGGGANTAVALAAAGHQVTLLAAIGHDAVGEALLAELAAAGVITTALVRLDQPTTRSYVLVDPLGERTVINIARCEEATPPQRLLDLSADVVYVRSRRLDLSGLLAVKSKHSLIIAHAPPSEPGSRPAHVVIASVSDLTAAECRSQSILGKTVSNGLARWTVLTAGEAGAHAYSADEALSVAARSVQPVDTTGAGDAFAAGLVHALVEHRPMAEALAIAARFGAEATLWPTSGLPRAAVQRLLQEI